MNTRLSLSLINKEALYVFQTELINAGVKIVDYIDPNFCENQLYWVDIYVSSIDLESAIDDFSNRYIRPAMRGLISNFDSTNCIKFRDLPPNPSIPSSSIATQTGVSLRVSHLYDYVPDSSQFRFETQIQFDKRYVQKRILIDQAAITGYEEQWATANVQNSAFLTYNAKYTPPMTFRNCLFDGASSYSSSLSNTVLEQKKEISAPKSDGKIHLDLSEPETEIEKVPISGHAIELE